MIFSMMTLENPSQLKGGIVLVALKWAHNIPVRRLVSAEKQTFGGKILCDGFTDI